MVILVDEDIDEEEETDNDHPGSDPDFGGNRRTISTKYVGFSSSFKFQIISFHYSVRRKKDNSTSVRMKSHSLLKFNSSLQRPAVNHFQVSICPLANKSYGIDLTKHPLRHVPCTRSNISSIYLFTHLRVFHCLSSKASCMYSKKIFFTKKQNLISFFL